MSERADPSLVEFDVLDWDRGSDMDITCPHCGHDHEDYWEWIEWDERYLLHDCDDCGKEFALRIETTHSYRTAVLEPETEGTVEG